MTESINLKEYIFEEMNAFEIEYEKRMTVLKDMLPLLIDNDLFGVNLMLNEDSGSPKLIINKEDTSAFKKGIHYFLEHYDKSVYEKNQVLMQRLIEKYSLTAQELEVFYAEHDFFDEGEQYILNDFLLYILHKDIHLYSNKEVEELIEHACEDLSLRSGRDLVYFLSWLRKKTKTNYIIDFELSKRRLYTNHSNAYDGDTILQMIYYLFNDSHIQNEEIFVNAATNPAIANCWIYLALHCICALRDTDIIRIPHPRLYSSPNEILESITPMGLKESIAVSAANSILWQLKHLPITPSKTSSYSAVSDIKLFIPDSSMILFGSMFAISEAHYQLKQKEGPFIIPVKDYNKISAYLGDDMGEIFLESDFRARSANKAYMQAIELLSDTILDNNAPMIKTKGYMLAALARSHKGSYGEFARTTKEYLEDAAFSGYSAEFVAKELLERGVCSFVVNMLLNIVTDNKFAKLSVSKQTRLIQETNMSAWEIDTFIGAMDTSFESAKQIVTKLFLNDEKGKKEDIIKILHNIGSGNAVSKSDDFLCLITAMDKPCPYKEAAQCIGCEYEITTKASIFVLINEFKRLLDLREATNKEHLKSKYTLLLKETVAPALSELFAVISTTYGEDATKEYTQMIKEVMDEHFIN